MYGDIVWRVFGVGPSKHSSLGSIEDVFGVGAREIRGEGHIEGVMNDRLSRRGRESGRGTVSRLVLLLLLLRCDGRHVHVRSRHAKPRAHPLGPMPHICQLVHDGREWSVVKIGGGKGEAEPSPSPWERVTQEKWREGGEWNEVGYSGADGEMLSINVSGRRSDLD